LPCDSFLNSFGNESFGKFFITMEDNDFDSVLRG
jgi:hypothetical protein